MTEEDRRPEAEPLPIHECDLVMKGGITSGIVYPGAAAAIARDYRLRSIGGTSVGAIAAIGAAAMEFGRSTGRRPDARRMLEETPAKLGAAGPDKIPLLTKLFEPDAETAPLFRLATELAASRSAEPLAPRLRAAIRRPFWIAAFIAAAGTGLLSWLEQPFDWLDLLVMVLLLAAATIVLAALLAWRLRSWEKATADLRTAFKAAADGGFGFCSGNARYREPDGGEQPSLLGWLHETVQELAGLPVDEPLTFGDLWTAGFRTGDNVRDDACKAALDDAKAKGEPAGSIAEVARAIDLAFVASDLSRGLSVQLPFMRREDRLYARKSDLSAMFPAPVVDAMAAAAREPALDNVALPEGIGRGDLIRLPAPQDLPVLFATRMSMSFPFLFKAVRLYLVRSRAAAEGGGEELAEIWFADGGITSNFPVHMFDSPIPSRPTFLLNLLYEKELVPDTHRARDKGEPAEGEGLAAGAQGPEEKEIYMPRSNQSGLTPFTRFPTGSPFGRLAGFAWQIINTARNWSDTQLMAVPGYRDRIVHIKMFEGEGGLNLAMDPVQIEKLKDRGYRAGRVIAQRFLPGQTKDPLNPGKILLLNWSNHRMVRLRAYLAGIEGAVARFAINWENDKARAARPDGDPQRVTPSLEEMVEKLGTKRSGELGQKSGYAFRNDTQRKLALAVVEALAALSALSARTPGTGLDFVRGKASSPRPKPALRLRAPSDSDPRAERVPR